MNITRHAIEQKGFFEGLDANLLIMIGVAIVILITFTTILVAFEIRSYHKIGISQSIMTAFLPSLFLVFILIGMFSFLFYKSDKSYKESMNEIEITGQTKIENVTVNEKQNIIATYQYKDKSQFIEFMTNESVNIKEGDTVRFDHYKDKIEKDSSTVTVSKKDIKDGKIKIQHK